MHPLSLRRPESLISSKQYPRLSAPSPTDLSFLRTHSANTGTSAILHPHLRNKAAGHCTLRWPPKLLKDKEETAEAEERKLSFKAVPPTHSAKVASWP